MAIYFECVESKANRIQSIISTIDRWVHSTALEKILASFGTSIPNGLSTTETINWLLSFSDEWDYRKKQQNAKDKKTNEAARWLLNDSEITETQSKAVLEGISDLGLVGVDTPLCRDYDYIVALGGARLSCLLRPKYASEVMEQFSIKPKAVIMLSGTRPIADSERSATDTYAKGAKTEYDLICKGAEQCFGLSKFDEQSHYDDNPNLSWAIRTYQSSVPVISIAGPSTEPELRRANSADTYKFFFEKFRISEGEKLLLVTSQIYVPYQQMEAIRTLLLPYGVLTETIGFPNEWSGNMQGMQQPINYLQEIRSTIQAISRFLSDEQKKG